MVPGIRILLSNVGSGTLLVSPPTSKFGYLLNCFDKWSQKAARAMWEALPGDPAFYSDTSGRID